MAKSSNNSNDAVKKVARAAETAGQRDQSFRSRLGFPTIIGLICVLGISLVTYARVTREAEALPVQNRDHWHAVYGVWDCTAAGGDGAYLPPFMSSLDPLGIHSHQDGIMHIHPFFDEADGPDAQLNVFFDAMAVEFSDTEMTLPAEMGGRTLANGADCGDGEAQLHVRKWQFDFVTDSTEPEIITTGLPEIQYLNDREVYIIAHAPLDAEIPLPPAERFDQLDGVAGAIRSTAPVTADGLDQDQNFVVPNPAGDDADADATTDDADTEDGDTDEDSDG